LQNLLIFEPDANGHRMVYVRRIACEAVRQSIPTTVLTTQSCLDHPAYVAMTTELGSQIKTDLLRPGKIAQRLINHPNLILKQLGYHVALTQHFRNMHKKDRPGVIFVPFIDHFDKAIAVLGSPFGSIPFGALCMLFKFHYGQMGALRPPERADKYKEWTFKRLLATKQLISLFTIDELLFEYTRLNYSTLFAKLHYVGDPVDMNVGCSRVEARARFGLLDDQFVVLIYGALDFRKGIGQLVEAATRPDFPSNGTVLLVGRQQPNVRDYLSSGKAAALRGQGKLIDLDQFVSEDDEYAAFRAADVVWVGYRGFYGMSGVLIQAGKMGLPVISCKSGLVGWMVNKYELGTALDTDRLEDIAQTVSRLQSDEPYRVALAANGTRLAAKHSSTQFGRQIIESLKII
jgi:glycosyltransferase involved in cell wall biosynthesis